MCLHFVPHVEEVNKIFILNFMFVRLNMFVHIFLMVKFSPSIISSAHL